MSTRKSRTQHVARATGAVAAVGLGFCLALVLVRVIRAALTDVPAEHLIPWCGAILGCAVALTVAELVDDYEAHKAGTCEHQECKTDAALTELAEKRDEK